jgi:Flp pilus assembly protein TadD
MALNTATTANRAQGAGAARWLVGLCVLALAGCATNEPATRKAQAPAPVSPQQTTNYQYALSLMRSGHDQQAQRLLQQLSQENPSLAGPHVNLGLLHLKAGHLDAAEKELSRAIKLNPDNAAAYNHLGILHRQRGDFEKAQDAYRQALKIDPDYALAHRNLGILYDLYLGDLGRALKHYERYQKLTGGDDRQVDKWIIDLKRRDTAQQKTGGDRG